MELSYFCEIYCLVYYVKIKWFVPVRCDDSQYIRVGNMWMPNTEHVLSVFIYESDLEFNISMPRKHFNCHVIIAR